MRLQIAYTERERAEFKARLTALEAGGGGGGGATDLSYNAATRLLASSTGADVTLPLAGANAGLMSAADKTKLDGLSTGGGLADTFETVNKNLAASDVTITYSSGEIASIAYANGITKTFGYGPNGLETVVLSGSTPGGIDLTKTLSYSSGQLSGVSYS